MSYHDIEQFTVLDLANRDPRDSASVTGQRRDAAETASPKFYALASASTSAREWVRLQQSAAALHLVGAEC